uniref:Chromo domain-containing protein n=1 Tax=Caenorhabditis tropicalis TaxID=1561998 RepID=A0A1I7UI32_9PELO
MLMFQYLMQVLKRVKEESIEENKKNKPEEVKKEEVKVEEVIEKPIGPVTNAHKELMRRKRYERDYCSHELNHFQSAEKEWEPETRYRNQGTVFIKSQNVSAADVSEERGRGFNYSNLCLIVVRSRTRRTGERSRSEEKKRGGGGISKVKWSDDPIVFYEIGDDFDRFEVDATGGTFSSSSVMTASIKKL